MTSTIRRETGPDLAWNLFMPGACGGVPVLLFPIGGAIGVATVVHAHNLLSEGSLFCGGRHDHVAVLGK